MMEQTKIYTALKGIRGRKSVDMPALEQLMVRFSQLVAEQKWIKEIDINPLLCSAEHQSAAVFRRAHSGAGCPRAALRPGRD